MGEERKEESRRGGEGRAGMSVDRTGLAANKQWRGRHNNVTGLSREGACTCRCVGCVGWLGRGLQAGWAGDMAAGCRRMHAGLAGQVGWNEHRAAASSTHYRPRLCHYGRRFPAMRPTLAACGKPTRPAARGSRMLRVSKGLLRRSARVLRQQPRPLYRYAGIDARATGCTRAAGPAPHRATAAGRWRWRWPM